MSETFIVLLLSIGVFFNLVAGLGLLRMPDLYMRVSATAKAATLGVGCLLGAAAIHFGELGVSSRAVATIVFIFFTAPVAGHMIGRAGYIAGVPLWEKNLTDQWRRDLDKETKQTLEEDSFTGEEGENV